MNGMKFLAGKCGIALCGTLLGYPSVVHGQSSVSVGTSMTMPAVEIRSESDFYEPLAPDGEWVVIGPYGRCWTPRHVARDWRPYCNGRWEPTDAGWYWVSDEPWAWATYHYGRWDYTDQYGWYWVPQTQWAPAWVSWHSGGGYIGWAPLQPSVSISSGGYVGLNPAVISPRAFVFVEQRRFLDPISPAVVVANNNTIIKQTTVMPNIRMANNTVINEGPAPAIVEKTSGRKVQTVPVQELRHKTEAAVAGRQRAPATTGEKNVQPPARKEAGPREQKNVPAREPAQIQKPDVITHEPAMSVPTNREVQNVAPQPVPVRPESKRVVSPGDDHSPAPQKPPQSKIDNQGANTPAAGQKDQSNPPNKDHEKKTGN